MGFEAVVSYDTQFTLDNIPFGVFSTERDPRPRCGVAIGDHALDLRALSVSGFFQSESVRAALSQVNLNAFAALPATVRTQVRVQLIEAIKSASLPEDCAHKLSSITSHLPVAIPGYTDFFCSLEHCQNCAPMSGGKVPENFFNVPLAYNGRASSVIQSPSLVRRPKGGLWRQASSGARQAEYGVSQMVDFELEMATIVSKPVPYGETIEVDEAPDHIFGFVLLNDWSSRDIQIHEMPPLGPFNSKSFGTTISPWVVTLDALDPFRTAPKHRTQPFEHLRFNDFDHGTFDIKLAVHLERDGQRHELCTSNLKYLYWTPFQQLTHHASANCGMRTGDLLGTGTISGDGVDEGGKKYELGCLYEATQHGSKPLQLENGMEVGYLQDGDSVILSAWCEDAAGRFQLGFGECRGQIVGADAYLTSAL